MGTTYFHPNNHTQIPVTSIEDIIRYNASTGNILSNIEIEFKDGLYLVLTSIQGSYICIGYVDNMIY